jgi:hypothetical protein
VEVLLSLSLARVLFTKGRSAQEEWNSWLPPEKRMLFETIRTRWDHTFTISGIALHDALEFRSAARNVHAGLQLQMTSEIVARNAAELARALSLIQNEASHLSDLPQVEPLDPANFHTNAAQRVAHWSTFFHWVLFDSRSRFFQKVRLLDALVEASSQRFASCAEELTESMPGDRQSSWDELAELECDLNTAARESEITLKGFLRYLPSNLTAGLAEALESPVPFSPRRSRTRRSRLYT